MPFIILLSLFGFFSLTVLFLALRLAPSQDASADRLEAILSDDPLTERYLPMERLLQDQDWKFLAAQPGFSRKRIRTIRAQRRDLFRRYLDCMRGDFGSICLLIRALMVQSEVPRPDLAKALFRCRFQFAVGIVSVEARLLAHSAGFSSVRIDIGALTTSLEELGSQIRSLQLVPRQLTA